MHAKRSWHALETNSPATHRYADPRAEFAKSETIEPALSAEPREPCLLSALQSPEEAVVRVIEALERSSLKRDGQTRGIGIAASPLGECFRLVDISASYACLPVG